MIAPLEKIPEHLQNYITEQDPSLYTPIDHASWRYIMRVSKAFFSKTAHPLYLRGLEVTGIATERIPLVSEMDAALRKMGWRAVAINGFIPPSVFLEFQSLRILAIACDMRKLENLGYTPSPDIVHEAAGHVPIVADPLYRKYLEAYGEAARNAIIDSHDLEVYDAIYRLSELKENPRTPPSAIAEAQKVFEKFSANPQPPSEAALLTRMAWWTTEYGLIGTVDHPMIYGAGLLSSVSESYDCLPDSPGSNRSEPVKIIPFSLDAVISTAYDITRPQPQLFVAPGFEELIEALDCFSRKMAYRVGGVHGLSAAKNSKNTVTVVMDNGLQFTGILDSFEVNEEGEETSLTLSGAKQLASENKTHPEVSHHFFGHTLYLPFVDQGAASASLEDIKRRLHGTGLIAKNGVRILGRFKKEVMLGDGVRLLLIESVKIIDLSGKTVFEERAKLYPLVIANRVISVFGGAADRAEFALRNPNRKSMVNAHKTNRTEQNDELCELYHAVRTFRESKRTDLETLDPQLNELTHLYPDDWLLRLEFYELYKKLLPNSLKTAKILQGLISLQSYDPQLKDLIERGLNMVKE